MGKREVIIVILLIFTGIIRSQENQETEKYYVRPGLISASATISPSIMLNREQINYYVTGFWQVRLDKNLSFRGEGHYLTGGNQNMPYFRNNFRAHFGVEYHRSIKNFDSYIGFMPGFSLLQLTEDRSVADEQMLRFVPGFSVNLGATYYVWKYFNFFANLTYLNTTVRGVTQTSNRADELMLSLGLGFNINAKK